MSRSIKHTPIFGLGTAEDKKRWKRCYNRDIRRKNAEILRLGRERCDLLVSSPVLCDTDMWTQDGWGHKYYWTPKCFWQKRGIRQEDHNEISEYRRLMRK